MYYEIVAGGQHTFKIRDTHEKYGTMNRNAGPFIVPVNNGKDQLYASTPGNFISMTRSSTIRYIRVDRRKVTNGQTFVDNLERPSKPLFHLTGSALNLRIPALHSQRFLITCIAFVELL